jgi:hypothetical protein
LTIDQTRVDADAAFLDTVAASLVRLARASGVTGLDAADFESWRFSRFFDEVVVPKQTAVANVVGPHVAAIEAQLPGCAVKFRGSLARGLKSFRKPDPGTGGVQRFDPTHFDADAFIEVDDDTWAELETIGASDATKLTVAGALALAEAAEHRELAASFTRIAAIEKQIQRGLVRVAGYSTKPDPDGPPRSRIGDFYLLVQSATKSSEQVEAGNPYRTGMLAAAGMPELEAASPSDPLYHEFKTGVGATRHGAPAIFTSEVHTRIAADNRRSETVSSWSVGV